MALLPSPEPVQFGQRENGVLKVLSIRAKPRDDSSPSNSCSCCPTAEAIRSVCRVDGLFYACQL
jgi:hypothetical protein